MKVLTIGTFDLFHEGHYRLLDRAVEFGDLHVGVNSDAFVTKYKGRAPEENESARLARILCLAFIDTVYLNDGPGADLIRSVEPDLLVIGSDWHDRYLPQIEMTATELFDKLGCGVVYLPRTPGVSTTDLRA